MNDVMKTPSADAASGLLDRDRVLALLHEYTEGAGLRKHAVAVEAAMRAYALRGSHDEALWGAAGLLHDMDYEKHPTPEATILRPCPCPRNAGFTAKSGI